MLRTWTFAWGTALAFVGCGDDGTTTGSGGASSTSTTSTSTTSTASGGSGVGGNFTVGGDRPTTVFVPASYDPGTPAPLLVNLHGYTVSGDEQEAYFNLLPVTEARGMLYVHPTGTIDEAGEEFWNATNACCDFYQTGADDVAYLTGVLAEIKQKRNVDPKRVYFVGHSNGGYMSYRMACDHADEVAAVVSLAGATYDNPADCAPSSPVTVVQIHGDLDDTVFYSGGVTDLGSYPSAQETVDSWAAYDACDVTVTDGTPLDVEDSIAGDETTVQIRASGCTGGTTVELWTMVGGGHVPSLSPTFGEQIVQFLLDHPKP